MTQTEAYELQKNILRGQLSDTELLHVFTELDRPLELEEFSGLYEASREAMTPVTNELELLDTCGTGGDGLDTFNISTAAALLCSALGVPVGKHGNRSASGRCGSADVLEELGVNINMDAKQVAECITATNFSFMFAPTYHPAFKHAAAARKVFGKRTYFNFLGPLLNPAGAGFRLVGVSDPAMAELTGNTLMRGGAKKVWVVHSEDGMDEISTASITKVLEFVSDTAVHRFTINPLDYDLELSPLEELRGGDRKRNAEIVRDVLNNNGSIAQRNAVVLNAAAGLVVAERVRSYAEGVVLAKRAITECVGIKKLEDIVRYTNQCEDSS